MTARAQSPLVLAADMKAHLARLGEVTDDKRTRLQCEMGSIEEEESPGTAAAKPMEVIKLPPLAGSGGFVDASFVATFRDMKEFIVMPLPEEDPSTMLRLCDFYRVSAIVCLSGEVPRPSCHEALSFLSLPVAAALVRL